MKHIAVKSPPSSMLYKILSLNILLIFYTWPAQAESGTCRDGITKNVPPHQLLRKDLFCSYDKQSYPVNDILKKLTVDVRLLISSISLNEHKNDLDVQAWLKMEWIDERLKWNPGDYSNVDILPVKSNNIWEPDISVHNRGNSATNWAWNFTHCVLESSGRVVCTPAIKWSVQCTANLHQWPFDQHMCMMIIGSWSLTGEEMELKSLGNGTRMDEFRGNPEWELLHSSAIKYTVTYGCCPNTTINFLKYKFLIKRHAEAYAATAVFPSLALTMLTLASYWLDPKKRDRIALCSVSTLCHCLYQQYLGLKLPVNGTKTPVIILLYRDSLIITTVAIALTVVVKRLSSRNDTSATSIPIPVWLDRFFGVVLSQKAGQLLLLGNFESTRGDGACLMENEPKSDEEKEKHGWIILVTIINRLGFLVSLIIYFVLYIALIPKY